MTDGAAEQALRAAQSRIARVLLGVDHGVDARMGELHLRPHQVTAVARILQIVEAYRGALLADAVGLGKTYVALAVAREYPTSLVICPAALRGMWEAAMRAATLAFPICSFESLSRGAVPGGRIDLLIIDEAHHLRTPGTRRYETVAHLAQRARMLLLSATPLHNSRRDLVALLALFAGTGISEWSDGALARLIVRRDDSLAAQSLPVVSGPHSLSPGADDDCLDAILDLPPTLPAADEGVAHALTTISLVHLWTSSRSALVASMRKRLARAMALRDAVASGHLPTASELAAWRYADEALQLAFPLFNSTDPIDQHALNGQLDRFIAGARALLDRCRTTPDPDEARVALIRNIRERHAGERIVAFSQYANTITALGRLMRGDPGIAVVTAAGARIASGSIPREEVLEQFTAGAKRVHPSERIDLMLTTDLLSEGIDLRGASVVVHLDLPWNPARMEQRVGRSRRIGSAFEAIHVYTFVPPTAAERMIELRRRLGDKVKVARSVIGGSFDPFGNSTRAASPVEAAETVRHLTEPWVAYAEGEDAGPTAIAAAASETRGWIAAVISSGVSRLIGDLGRGVTEDARQLGDALARIGVAHPVEEARRASVLQAIGEWLAARDASACTEIQSTARRAILDRLAQTVARAPRHLRSARILSARKTRAALSEAAGVGNERVLATLARSSADDAPWLEALEEFATLQSSDATRSPRTEIVAVILLEPTAMVADATPG